MSFRSLPTLALLCSSAILLNAHAQSGSLISTLENKNKQINDSLIKGDPDPVRDLFSPSATITNPAGGLVGPGELFALVKSGTLKYTSVQPSEEKLAQYRNVAILTYLNLDAGTMQGHDISGKTRWTEVWVEQKGQWKIVAVQGTNVSPEP